MTLKIKNEMQEITKKVKEKMQEARELLPISNFKTHELEKLGFSCAFIIFNSAHTPINIEKDFNEKFSKSWKNYICCDSPDPGANYKLKGVRPTMTQPDHPINIYWENLEYGGASRAFKLLGVIFVSLLLIAISILITFFLTVLDESSTQNCTGDTPTLVDIQNTAQDLKAPLIYCYCASLDTTSLITNSDNAVFCKGYINKLLLSYGISISVAIGIIVTNQVSQLIIFKLVKKVRLDSRTDVIIIKIVITLVTEIINTLFVVVLVYGNINGFSIVTFLNLTFGFGFQIAAHFSSITRSWYNLIGLKLLYTMIVLIAAGPFLKLFLDGFSNCVRHIKLGYAKNSHRVKELLPPTFKLDTYKDSLLVIFLAMTFGTGIPALFPLACFYFFFSYWKDKITAFRFARKPKAYSFNLVQTIHSILPFSIVLHLLMSLFMLGNWEVYPTSNQALDESNIDSVGRMISDSIGKSIWLSLYSGAVLGLLVLEFLLHSVIVSFLSQRRVLPESELGSYKDNYDKIKYFGLPNYNIALNPKYKSLLKMDLVNHQSLNDFLKRYSFENLSSANLSESKKQKVIDLKPFKS